LITSEGDKRKKIESRRVAVVEQSFEDGGIVALCLPTSRRRGDHHVFTGQKVSARLHLVRIEVSDTLHPLEERRDLRIDV
jgi:hypothetical protein